MVGCWGWVRVMAEVGYFLMIFGFSLKMLKSEDLFWATLSNLRRWGLDLSVGRHSIIDSCMKAVFWMLAVIGWLAIFSHAGAQDAAKSTVKLTSGEVMSGVVGAVKDGSLSLITEYGPVRIPLDKISPESKAKLGISGDTANAAALAARVRELEALVERLREENAMLRRAGASPAANPAVSRVTPSSGASTESPGVGTGYRISSTGKRHNSRCRYYSSNGRAGTANEGVACKVCGG